MPCKIQIKQNLTNTVTEMTNSAMNKSFEEATFIAKEVNKKFKSPVVSFIEMQNNSFERRINIPIELIDKYYDNEKIIESKEITTVSLSPEQVSFELKAINLLSSQKAIDVFSKGKKNNWDLNKILTELQIPKEQKQLILDSGKTNLEKPNVILPIGTSGSGKSTFIKSLPQENLVIIEPDAMRVEFTGDVNDKSKDKDIYVEAANRAIKAIKEGKQVVFDTTNLTKDKRLPFIEAIKKEIPDANIQYKLMELNPELAKQRIRAQLERGENRANVTNSTIDRHAESYKQMLEDIKNEPINNYDKDLRTDIITDEHGNTWNQVVIDSQKEQQKILLQTENVSASKSSPKTVDRILEVAKQMGINVTSLEDYAKQNPAISTKGINGLADLVQGVVAVATGKEDVALTEEVVHIATAILEQTNPKLVTELISKITRFKIYNEVLKEYSGNKNYQLGNGKPDIRKIKKEAVDKLIAEVIINQSEGSTSFPELMEEETRYAIKEWWNTILDFIKGMYRKSNLDIFNIAAKSILNNEVSGVENLKNDGNNGVFLQTTKNLVNDFYNTIKSYGDKLILNEKTATETRHYTYDGVRVASSVTEKHNKVKKTFKERTDEEKIIDDQKAEWGSRGHAFIDNYISKNLIDKEGFKKDVFTEENILTELNDVMKTQLINFSKELINSYKPGTRFIIEQKVVNTKEKGLLASTIDFAAIEPTDDGKSFFVDILDWKFYGLNKEQEDDIPFYKQKDWIPQMGEYNRIMQNYGMKPSQLRKARMIPFIANYEYAVARVKESGLALKSIEIGKLDSTKETNLYLLPVPLNIEKTGNKKIDALIASLRVQYDKMRIKPTTDRFKKDFELSSLSKAIRHLHLQLNFDPLFNVAQTFLNNAAISVKQFENIDYKNMTEEDIRAKLESLNDMQASAEKFAFLDEVFLSEYPKESLSAEDKVLLNKLKTVSSRVKNMFLSIEQLQKEYVVYIAVATKITKEQEQIEGESIQNTILDAEIAVESLAKSFTDASKLSPKIIKLAANMWMKAQKLVGIKIKRQIEDFGEVLLPLEKIASSREVSAFSLIGAAKDGILKLNYKIDNEFWKQTKEAKKTLNKKFLMANMDMIKYRQLAKETVEKGTVTIKNTHYSDNEEENSIRQSREISKLQNQVNIEGEFFSGGYLFNKIFNEAMIEEGHYSKEYEQMMKTPEILEAWKFFTDLNKRAIEMGYIEKQGSSFFPLIEATLFDKFKNTSDIKRQSLDFIQDSYTSRINEDQTFSKIDPETGKVKKVIPKYFTKTDKLVEQLSTDLNKVGTMWIKAINQYENSKNMEPVLLTLYSIEKNKGSLMTDTSGVIMEGGDPKINKDENKNADLLQTIIDDYLYDLTEDVDSFLNVGVSSLVGKVNNNEESKQKTVVNIRKSLKSADKLIRNLALGLKPLLAIANFVGGNFQAYINSSNLYKASDFFKNEAKVISGIGFSTIEKGVLDMFIPLMEDVSLEERRKLAAKQGYIKLLSTWSFSDIFMLSNSFPDRKIQLSNALSFLDNAVLIDGNVENARQYVTKQDRVVRSTLSESERLFLEKTYENRVAELIENNNLYKLAKIENDRVVIDGLSDNAIANYSLKISEYGRKLNGQMSEENKMGYRRDTIFSSFMMFKGWIPKMITTRAGGLKEVVEEELWEYGRARAFFKTLTHIGFTNIGDLKEIIQGTDKGLSIINEILESKKQEHFRLTGQNLEISEEEFQDLIRMHIANQFKELQVLVSVVLLIAVAHSAEPPEDASILEKNRYKWAFKAINKVADEITFFYNPLSFDDITKGSITPSLGLLTKIAQLFANIAKEGYGIVTENEKMVEKAHPFKYLFNLIPGASQFQNEILPYTNPELAKEMGIKVGTQSRR